MAEWFEHWFNEDYLALYPHRDDADAERLVDLIRRTVPWRAGLRVLDVACGPGRHARALEAAGACCTGVDLSAVLLARARGATNAALVRADMRELPIRAGSMDLTVNLFTSFGYFESDSAHAAALAEMAATVRPGGWFVLDFLHASQVRAHLIERHGVPAADAAVRVSRHLSSDGRYVSKTIELADGRCFQERVRLFEPAELERMLADAGVPPLHRYGDYGGAPIGPRSPRVVLMGRAA